MSVFPSNLCLETASRSQYLMEISFHFFQICRTLMGGSSSCPSRGRWRGPDSTKLRLRGCNGGHSKLLGVRRRVSFWVWSLGFRCYLPCRRRRLSSLIRHVRNLFDLHLCYLCRRLCRKLLLEQAGFPEGKLAGSRPGSLPTPALLPARFVLRGGIPGRRLQKLVCTWRR